MEHLRYNASIDREEDKSGLLFDDWMIVLAIIIVVATLILVFPGKSMVNTLQNEDYISEVDLNYSLLLRENTSPAIRYSDIRQTPATVLTQLDEVLKQNKPLVDIWFNYIIVRAIAYDADLAPVVKQKADTTMLHYFDALKERKITDQQLDQLARDALSINQSTYALAFYEQLIARNPKRGSVFYASIGRVALWADQCIKSAEYYFTTQHESSSLEDKRLYYFQALKILFQCNQSSIAIRLAEKNIDGLSNDAQTYQMLVDLAIKGDQPAMAQQYLIKYLELKNKKQ